MRKITTLLILLSCSPGFAQDLDHINNATEFYIELTSAVSKSNEPKDIIAKLLRYPYKHMNVTYSNYEQLKPKTKTIIPDSVINLLKCTNSIDVQKVGWRGYMVSNGAIWFDRVYFGEIKPDKESKEYPKQIQSMLNDKNNWHMRLYGFNPELAVCNKSPNKALK